MDHEQDRADGNAAIREIENIIEKEHVDKIYHKAIGDAVNQVADPSGDQQRGSGIAEKGVALIAEQQHCNRHSRRHSDGNHKPHDILKQSKSRPGIFHIGKFQQPRDHCYSSHGFKLGQHEIFDNLVHGQQDSRHNDHSNRSESIPVLAFRFQNNPLFQNSRSERGCCKLAAAPHSFWISAKAALRVTFSGLCQSIWLFLCYLFRLLLPKSTLSPNSKLLK